VAVALILAAVDLCARVVRARAGRAPEGTPRLLWLWLGAAGCLVAAYAVQETLEGALAPGHPGGLAGVVGHGGWAAIPLAAAIGLVIALVVGGAQRAIELAAEPPVRVARPRTLVSLGSTVRERRSGGLRRVRRLRARAPPLASIP
jgi:hypothetical protein